MFQSGRSCCASGARVNEHDPGGRSRRRLRRSPGAGVRPLAGGWPPRAYPACIGTDGRVGDVGGGDYARCVRLHDARRLRLLPPVRRHSVRHHRVLVRLLHGSVHDRARDGRAARRDRIHAYILAVPGQNVSGHETDVFRTSQHYEYFVKK